MREEEEIVEIGGMEFIPLDEDLLEEKSWMCSGYTHIQLNGQRMRPSSPPNFGGGRMNYGLIGEYWYWFVDI